MPIFLIQVPVLVISVSYKIKILLCFHLIEKKKKETNCIFKKYDDVKKKTVRGSWYLKRVWFHRGPTWATDRLEDRLGIYRLRGHAKGHRWIASYKLLIIRNRGAVACKDRVGVFRGRTGFGSVVINFHTPFLIEKDPKRLARRPTAFVCWQRNSVADNWKRGDRVLKTGLAKVCAAFSFIIVAFVDLSL